MKQGFGLLAGFSLAMSQALAIAPAASAGLGAAAMQAMATQSPAALASRIDPTPATPAADASGRYLYVLLFQEPSLAVYDGSIAGLPATSPRKTGARKLDANSNEAIAYRNHLEHRQDQHLAGVAQAIGRVVEPRRQYLNVLNGAAVALTIDEARVVAALPPVKAVLIDEEMQPDTDVGPTWIGAPAFWNGATTSGVGNRGEGVIVGIIDGGIRANHDAFAAIASDGYTHVNPFGAGVYTGYCATNAGVCTDKLIGYHVLAGSFAGDAHGTHVGSTAAGNPLSADFLGLGFEVSGVAPRANLISYQVCAPGCAQSNSAAAVNLAVAEGVDVLNYSISGSDSPWNTIIDLAFLQANEAGISVAVSAGNTGPNPATTTKTGAWVVGVANYSHDRIVGNGVDAAGLTGLVSVQGTGPQLTADITAPVIDAATAMPGNELGCNPFPAGTFNGAIAFLQRGSCTFAIKEGNVRAAGAVAMLLFNSQGGPPSVAGGLETAVIPVTMLDQPDGLEVRAAIAGNPGSQATIHLAASIDFRDSWGDVTAGTSGRGPSQFDVLKPDFAAPGTNILAAGMTAPTDSLAFMSGTSMASPHGAGSLALVIGQHPDWSPAMVKSAISLTARSEGLVKENGSTPADPFDRGSGMIDLTGAAVIGFALDETHANYVAANPAIGGDPRTLNQASVQDRACAGTCTWQRTLTSVLPDAEEYTVSVVAPNGMWVAVEPATFSLAAGDTQTLAITADVASFPLNSWQFADVVITPASAEVAIARLPLAIRGVAAPAAAVIDVDPTDIALSLKPDASDEVLLSVGNGGAQTLIWSLAAESGGSAPDWLVPDPPSGTTAGGASRDVVLGFDATGLAPGTYEATLTITSNDPATPAVEVPVTLTVTDPDDAIFADGFECADGLPGCPA